jgi:hypothetical protein
MQIEKPDLAIRTNVKNKLKWLLIHCLLIYNSLKERQKNDIAWNHQFSHISFFRPFLFIGKSSIYVQN